MDQRKRRTILFLGIALFAMFFGAGNLLLPAFLGFETRTGWTTTFSGFALTAILAPFLAIYAVALSGNYFTDLGSRANVKLAYALSLVNVLCIGPLIALPRSGASVYEVAIQPLLPDAQPVWVSVVFFGVVMILSLSLERITEILGKFLGPLLLILLLILIIPGFFTTNSVEFEAMVSNDLFYKGFNEGYQTMDVLAALIFAVILIAGAKQKSYAHVNDRIEVVVKSAIFAAACMLLVYGGLFYLGGNADINHPEIGRSDLLLHIAQQNLGSNGIYLISVLMMVASATTAVALTAGSANFFERLTKGKLGYIEAVISITIVSVILGITGVDAIIEYAAGLLNFIYPVTLVLILSVLLFGGTIKNQKPYFITLIVTMLFSSLRVLVKWFPEQTSFNDILQMLPLSDYNLEWVLPAVLTFLISCFALGRNLNHQ